VVNALNENFPQSAVSVLKDLLVPVLLVETET